MIKQRNISIISNKTYKETNYRIPELVIEKDYCISWLLVGFSKSPLNKALAFKGGTSLRRCYFAEYRFSEDLDFTIVEKISLDSILKEFLAIFELLKQESGINFSIGKVEPDSLNNHTFYIMYDGPLPTTNNLKQVKVDISFNEIVLTQLIKKEVLKTYPEFSDLPDGALVKVYSLEEISIEKAAALLDPARNEPRDLYDLWYLVEIIGIDLTCLTDFIITKIANKKKSFDKIKGNLIVKEKLLKRAWKKRLSNQVGSLPEFENVFRSVKRAFRRSGL